MNTWCILLGTIRGQVGHLTMAKLLTTGHYCGNGVLKLLGKEGGCLKVLHCSCWMMGIMGVCDADCCFFPPHFFFFFFLKAVQSNILSGQAGDSVPSAAGNNRAACPFEGHHFLYLTTAHRSTIQGSKFYCMSNLNTPKKTRQTDTLSRGTL